MNIFQKRLSKTVKNNIRKYGFCLYGNYAKSYYEERKFLKECHREVCKMYGCSIFSLGLKDKKNRNILNEHGKINYGIEIIKGE